MAFWRGVLDELTGTAERRRFGYRILEIASDEIRREADALHGRGGLAVAGRVEGMRMAANLIDPDKQ
jgi:hypothetical protein